MMTLGGRWIQKGRAGTAAPIPGFSPASNFSFGQQGAWYDPSGFATLYQDGAGISSVTAVTQPDGLMLDKRRGLVPGPESVLNGNFTAGGANWTPGVGVVITDKLNCTAASNIATQTAVFAANKYYQITFDVVKTTGVNVRLNNGPGFNMQPIWDAGTGSKSAIVSCTTGGSLILEADNGAFSGTIDNVSVKELAGNHIFQATLTARPIVNASNGAQYLTCDGLDDGMSTGPITLVASMDCYIAIRRSDATKGILFGSNPNSNKYVGAFVPGDGGLAVDVSSGGAPTIQVNGVAVPGGNAVTRDQLNTAVPVSAWCVVSFASLDLSNAGYAQDGLVLFGYNGFKVTGDFGGMILCPAGDATNRANNRKWLGAKVGLSL